MGSLVVCPHCQTRVLPMAGRRCPACQQDVDTPPAEPAPQQVAEAAYVGAAEQLLAGGDPAEVRAGLARQGLDAREAARVVDELRQVKDQARKVAARKNMFYGVFWCIGGLAVTVITYQTAADMGGGRFIIAWGATLFGAGQFLHGLAQLGRE